jgi:phage shock protein A
MPDAEEPDLEDIRGKIRAWANRAEMAKQLGNAELVQQALERKRQYENALARIQEFNIGDR